MGLDVNSCCRLCLANAGTANATHIDLAEYQEVSEMVQELYGLKINSSGRGSKLLCMVCYKKTIDLKKHLTGYQTKTKLVSLNQAILKAQVSAFPEPESDDDAPIQEGYCAPASSKQQLFLLVEDCMRSTRFQDRLTDRYDLLYLRVSGPVYQSSTNDHVDMWFPDEFRCDRCLTEFVTRDDLKAHLETTCKFKCNYCRRLYSFEESLQNHVCQKRDRSVKEKRKRLQNFAMKTVGKRFRIDTVDQGEEGKEKEEELAEKTVETSVEKNAEKTVDKPAAEKNDLKLVPILPRNEGEANLDVELSSLLERWYGGQNEELEELTNLDLEAIESASNGVIAVTQNDTAPPKPAISVKPMSQLIGSPLQQSLLNSVPAIDSRPYNDVIEIEDETEQRAVIPVAAAAPPQQQQQQVANKSDQQSLSESDILNIVKHFRGIDENESYLIKAKINGASKLICISKRKGETGSVPSATIVNNNNTGQANGGSSTSNGSSSSSSKPAQTAVPTAVRRPTSPPPLVSTATNSTMNKNPPPRRPTMKYVPPRGTSYMKHTTGSINGPKMAANIPPVAAAPMPQMVKKSTPSQVAPMPQLKIAHVESLVAPNTMPPHQQQPRVLNGQMLNPGMQQYNRTPAAPVANTAKSPNTISPGNIAPKPAPRRIIVGSNSIKMLNNPRTILPKPVAQPMVRSPPKPIVTTTSTQQRIVVQRKQIKTVVQSTVRRNSIQTAVPVPGGSSNSLLRTQLLQPQQPPRIYPGPSGATAGGQNVNTSVATSADQLLSSLNSSNRQFKLNNTTFKRLD